MSAGSGWLATLKLLMVASCMLVGRFSKGKKSSDVKTHIFAVLLCVFLIKFSVFI